jgi:ketosteroid isomerase-like protein
MAPTAKMVDMRSAVTFTLVMLVTPVLAQNGVSPELRKLADTERAFAKRAQEVAVRDAFIEFFADESIGFEPEPTPARESLRKQTRPQPAGFQLLWEPRVGDIAASGDLGYLTGPSETIVPGQPTRYGNYFSVWKRQADGEFRVILDVGGGTPEKVVYAPGFTHATPVATWKGAEPKTKSEGSLLEADKAFSSAVASKGPAAAYASVMHRDARVQRPGFQPMTSRAAAVEWLNTNVKEWSTEPVKAETGASGDLGYTWGKFNVTPSARAAYSGYYVRVWTRNGDGTWQLAAEVTTPPPPVKQ